MGIVNQSDIKVGTIVRYICESSTYYNLIGKVLNVTYSIFDPTLIKTVCVEFEQTYYSIQTVWFIFNANYFDLIKEDPKPWSIDKLDGTGNWPQEQICSICGRKNDMDVIKCWFCENSLLFSISISSH